ncbi:MAG: hypothetical protein CTY29_08190 [Methylobacter sp.]|nr:MAG: hypothetical protein CTY29_08190 [Methylobacter sp.]PPD18302.1 MAG: hypothetical protein CTY24_13245 [Methylobacter sp.]
MFCSQPSRHTKPARQNISNQRIWILKNVEGLGEYRFNKVIPIVAASWTSQNQVLLRFRFDAIRAFLSQYTVLVGDLLDKRNVRLVKQLERFELNNEGVTVV